MRGDRHQPHSPDSDGSVIRGNLALPLGLVGGMGSIGDNLGRLHQPTAALAKAHVTLSDSALHANRHWPLP